jgi:hypothetical protein
LYGLDPVWRRGPTKLVLLKLLREKRRVVFFSPSDMAATKFSLPTMQTLRLILRTGKPWSRTIRRSASGQRAPHRHRGQQGSNDRDLVSESPRSVARNEGRSSDCEPIDEGVVDELGVTVGSRVARHGRTNASRATFRRYGGSSAARRSRSTTGSQPQRVHRALQPVTRSIRSLPPASGVRK